MSQTLTFLCHHCGRRMGVTNDLFGRSVRCPHCRLVVAAPLSADAPLSGTAHLAAIPPSAIYRPPASSVGVPPDESKESDDPDAGEDSLFVAPPKIVPVSTSPSALITTVVPALSNTPADAVSPTTVESAPIIASAYRHPLAQQPSRRRNLILSLLAAYAVMMTVLAVWGWMRLK